MDCRSVKSGSVWIAKLRSRLVSYRGVARPVLRQKPKIMTWNGVENTSPLESLIKTQGNCIYDSGSRSKPNAVKGSHLLSLF